MPLSTSPGMLEAEAAINRPPFPWAIVPAMLRGGEMKSKKKSLSWSMAIRAIALGASRSLAMRS